MSSSKVVRSKTFPRPFIAIDFACVEMAVAGVQGVTNGVPGDFAGRAAKDTEPPHRGYYTIV
jgi:hypothetical protein